MRSRPGVPYPLGATWDGSGTNFAMFSEVAERVELCLFDNEDESRIDLTEVGSQIHRGTVLIRDLSFFRQRTNHALSSQGVFR
jgi:isoamylase